MSFDKHELEQLVNNPSESLAVELKDWIDPESSEGKAKIVKTSIAMRNNDGGFLLIGFNDSDGTPSPENSPQDVESSFHVDIIQGLVARFASEAFEIGVYYPEIAGIKYVVIEIPSGVKSPVATKSGLDENGIHHVKVNKVYVRSLQSNNTPSTTEATYKDWPLIVEKCFENREADIGRFVRRHLASLSSDELSNAFLNLVTNGKAQDESMFEKTIGFVNQSFSRFQSIADERSLSLPEHGSMEVGVVIAGNTSEHSANQDFLNLIGSTNPSYTGWPAWLDSRTFTDTSARPFVLDGVWEAFIAHVGLTWRDHLDYWRIHPNGQFYLYRGFQDDIGGGDKMPVPCTALDFGLAIIRVAEIIAVVLDFAKAMGVENDSELYFLFRWRGIQGRTLTSWANPERTLSCDRTAYQDEIVTHLEVPIDTAKTAIYGYVHQVTSKLFEAFDGFVLSDKVTDDLVRRLLERRL